MSKRKDKMDVSEDDERKILCWRKYPAIHLALTRRDHELINVSISQQLLSPCSKSRRCAKPLTVQKSSSTASSVIFAMSNRCRLHSNGSTKNTVASICSSTMRASSPRACYWTPKIQLNFTAPWRQTSLACVWWRAKPFDSWRRRTRRRARLDTSSTSTRSLAIKFMLAYREPRWAHMRWVDVEINILNFIDPPKQPLNGMYPASKWVVARVESNLISLIND